ncbi:MAG: hypothetical protein ACOC2L_03170 [Candidatus Sumerlaeota bacterium]
MKIELTREEFRNLLDMVYMADWVMNAHTTQLREETAPYKEIEQKILSYAEEMGFQELVQHDEKSGRFFPSAKYEQEAKSMEFIEQFTDQSFWDDLIGRLADRDAIKMAGGIEAYRDWPLEKKFRILEDLERKYIDAFQKKGLNALKLSPSKKRKP